MPNGVTKDKILYIIDSLKHSIERGVQPKQRNKEKLEKTKVNIVVEMTDELGMKNGPMNDDG